MEAGAKRTQATLNKREARTMEVVVAGAYQFTKLRNYGEAKSIRNNMPITLFNQSTYTFSRFPSDKERIENDLFRRAIIEVFRLQHF